MTQVVLIRPGATVYDEQNRVQGILDIPLSARGRLAAAAMSRHPAALQLRLLQTVIQVASEKNATLVLPFPVELLRFLERSTPERDDQATAPADGETPELTAPKVPDDARGIALDGPITGRRSGQNA